MILTRNIKQYCADRKNKIKISIKESGMTPQLAMIEFGDNKASTAYTKSKIKDCNEVGIISHCYVYEENISTADFIIELKDLQEHYDAIIVQAPFPKTLDLDLIKMAIDPNKDVDGFHPLSKFHPCTPTGIINYLTFGCNYDLNGKNVTIINRSDIVGKPLAKMMTNLNATVTLCHSKTKDLWQHIQTADLIVVAVGKLKFLNCYAIHKPVVDVGINFDENGKMCGDCFNTENRDVTPVPGGVGLLTRVAFLENVCAAAGIEVND